MQEEVTNKTVALCIRTTKLTADVLKSAMRAYLRSHSQKSNEKKQAKIQKKNQPKQGKIKVKELAAQNAGMTNIEITNKNIRSFEKYARQYGVNFALKKDRTKNPPVYLVFFKASQYLFGSFDRYSHLLFKWHFYPMFQREIEFFNIKTE